MRATIETAAETVSLPIFKLSISDYKSGQLTLTSPYRTGILVRLNQHFSIFREITFKTTDIRIKENKSVLIVMTLMFVFGKSEVRISK